jgi:D-xylose transport system permease protein
MTDTIPPVAHPHGSADAQPGAVTRFLRATEIDTRLLGMVGALLLIWIGFHVYPAFASLFSGNGFDLSLGNFLTPRNLWNLSVQTSYIGIMATGMVLVIIIRCIDLSVGSIIAVSGMCMGLLQAEFLPDYLGLGHPAIWVITAAVGLVIGTLIGAFHGWLIAYRNIPSFIVTLGGLLIWRGMAFLSASGRTIAPLDETFALLGGGPYGTVGAVGSWIVGALGCIGLLWLLQNGRAQRRQHDFPLRPVWAEVFLGVVGCGVIIGAVLLVNAYPWAKGIVANYAAATGQDLPEGTFISHGFAIPVLLLIAVGIAMTILMTRTRFGRYVFAIGGNPEAALLAGINTRWVTLKVFALMGALAGLAAVITSARQNSATNAMGELDELYVIAAAVIGGTSLAGGSGTVYGAILGALVILSLQSGMVLIGFGDGSYQKIVVGTSLVLAVYLDILYRKNVK